MGKRSRSQDAAYRDAWARKGIRVRVWGSGEHQVGDKVGKRGEVVKAGRNGGRS